MSTTDEFILRALREPKLWAQAAISVIIGWAVLVVILA